MMPMRVVCEMPPEEDEDESEVELLLLLGSVLLLLPPFGSVLPPVLPPLPLGSVLLG